MNLIEAIETYKIQQGMAEHIKDPVEALQVIAQQLAASDNGTSTIRPHVKCALKGISTHNLPLGNEKPTRVPPDRLILVGCWMLF